MLVRSFSLQWILILALVLIILYESLRLNHLEENNQTLQNALQQIKLDVGAGAKKELQQQQQQQQQHQEKPKARPISSDDNYVVIYNRVPKTGSTSFVGLVYDTCKKNKFHALHINVTNNMHTLTLPNQMQFAHNITHWDSIKPAFYHGHMAFLDFQKLGIAANPLYINLLRKPLDRFVSYYYFLRYGDNFRPYLVRRKSGDKKTFDECVRDGQLDCDPNNMWLQIPFLCGHDPACWEIGNEWALEEAKRNLHKHYLLVGVTEELAEFVQVLETVLPRFFKGSYNLFMHNNKSHLRQTTQKIEPLPETVKKIQKSIVWKMENDLYNYALSQFHAVKKRVINGSVQDLNQRYFYEKIRPK
ncbi:unnamed protein product [Trichogramma brassicae]|uniref:Heparan sulfate 2-O-sulfotransferase 1 n=1 Tax=Trichogramma brassicae TaxID=86971 RepID=A0A6H5I1Y0_9HYME|nr:unnamed protein product [Trichogramma brassicae]